MRHRAAEKGGAAAYQKPSAPQRFAIRSVRSAPSHVISVGACRGAFYSIFRDKNRRDIGKSQPKWTAHQKMETPPRTATSPTSAQAAKPSSR
jgi:hypothetical protein